MNNESTPDQLKSIDFDIDIDAINTNYFYATDKFVADSDKSK